MDLLKLQITEKIGEFISWIYCCCKKAPKNETVVNKCTVSNTPIESDTEVADKSEQKRVHFSNMEEVITIPARSTKQRIWKPLASRINYVFHNIMYFLCYPCISLIQVCFKWSTPEIEEGAQIQNSSRAERIIPNSN